MTDEEEPYIQNSPSNTEVLGEAATAKRAASCEPRNCRLGRLHSRNRCIFSIICALFSAFSFAAFAFRTKSVTSARACRRIEVTRRRCPMTGEKSTKK